MTYCQPCTEHNLQMYVTNNVSIDTLIDEGCKFMRIDKSLILANTRVREVVEIRQMIQCYLADMRRIKLCTIGKAFNRDHTTVINSRSVVKDLCYTDPSFQYRYDQLCEHLNLFI